jgi:hypothetical protein
VQQGGGVLDLVQNEGSAGLIEEGYWIGQGAGTYVGALEGKIALGIPKLCAQQSRLASLPRAGHQHRREGRYGTTYGLGQDTRDIMHRYALLGILANIISDFRFASLRNVE